MSGRTSTSQPQHSVRRRLIKGEHYTVAQQRQGLIIKATVNDLLRNAETVLLEFRRVRSQAILNKKPAYGQSTLKALARARNYTEQALALDPSNLRAKEAMAEVLSEEGYHLSGKGENTAAVDKFRSAISLRPDQAVYHLLLAGVLLKMGDFESAVMESRTAQRLDPDDENSAYVVGMMLAYTGDVNGAVATFRNMNVRLGNVGLGPDGSYLRHCFAGMTLNTLIDEAENDPGMSKAREKFPRKALKEAALKELKDCLRLAPNSAESQEWIMDARTQIRELER
jgi:tetratricopeptide (TPR) repeat protein